jgi:hypothetical protein
MELDGNNQYVSYGDLTFLNAVSTFTVMFWMNQDVLDQTDIIFVKSLDATNYIRIFTWATGGVLAIEIAVAGVNRASFDYSTAVSSSSWHHVAVVFDGSQTGDANRLVVCVDGVPVTLAFPAGSMPAITADLAGQDAQIGRATSSFDGKLKDFRIFSRALSAGEIIACMHPTT